MRHALVIIVAILCTLPAASQMDELVPFDEGGLLTVITRDLNDRMKLFSPAGTFVEAHLYRQPDSTTVLEIVRSSGATITRERKTLSAAELFDIRTRVAQYMALNDDVEIKRVPLTTRMRSADPDRPTSVSGYDQSGRSGLLWGSTLWSLVYYGTAASTALGLYENESGASPVAATYILAGGLGYLVPALLTNDAPVSDGAATLALGGMFQGAIHGWLLSGLIGGDDVSERLGFGLSLLTGISETVAGYTIGTKTDITEGTASVINTTEFYGMAAGGLLGLTLIGTDETSGDAAIRVSSGLAIAGAVGGIFAGMAMADAQHFTSSDATVYGVSGLLGAFLPLCVLSAVQPDELDARVASGLVVVGIVGGLASGTALVRGRDYRSGDGTGIALGTFAGALVGAGLAVLMEDAQSAPILTWAGAAGGFALGLGMASPELDLGLGGELDIDINPLGLVLGAQFTRPVPVGSLTYRF